jgi:large subunit ribosomal protein L25
MTAIRPQEAVKLAKTLPPRLLTFFRRFPPTNTYATGPQRPELPTTSSPSPDTVATSTIPSKPSAKDILRSSVIWSDQAYNPFQPWKNPVTGRWRGPMYGLRRQADIAKMAKRYGVEELLPFSPKLSWVKREKREEQGLQVKGTGVGQKVKGKEWERTVKGRLEKRRQAMLKMPEMIQQWKEVSIFVLEIPWLRTFKLTN